MADLATPIDALLAEMDISLYDLEFSAGTLSVTVTRPGGIDLDTVAAANIAIAIIERDGSAAQRQLMPAQKARNHAATPQDAPIR